MPGLRPKILLIGAGRFGLAHLVEWKRLAADGDVDIAGIVVNSEASRKAIEAEHGIPVHHQLDDALVRGVDAVDIVTPSETHGALVRRCLPLANVLVEKPLAMDPAEAGELRKLAVKSGHVLMVGHLFRFHPVVRELKRIVADIAEPPRGIEGVMTNPREAGVELKDPNLEFLHLFDIVDFLFGFEPDMNSGRRTACVNHVSIRYPGPMNVNLKMGWAGEAKARVLKLLYSDREITANLIDNSIVVAGRDNQVHKTFFPAEPQALREELRRFLAAIGDRTIAYPDALVGERLVRVAIAARPRPEKDRPTVGVIGGGIFGATCALELAKVAQVSLFERHAELLTEVSFNNQFRHHSGFHYPRSYDTIAEIKATRKDFEAEYEEAIIRDFPSYFCTSATGIEIPAERYLAACMNSNLAFTLGGPPEGMLDLSKVNLCLKTDEAVYNVPRLRQIVSERLQRNKDIRFHPGTEVMSAAIGADGSKRLTVAGPGGEREESFDFIVNATYSNRNLLAKWFGFPIEPLRFDLYELLVFRLPIPQVCITIIDGPFTSLVGTGTEGEFLLSHIHNSVSRSVIPADGMPPDWGVLPTNRATMLRHSARYFPILSKATDVQSRWATRAVNAYARDFDARPTVITNHGFGCWSVLGGKIITCVSNAREIAQEILGEQRNSESDKLRLRASRST
jgi:predicted dehydrogenase/glycine/D-amino acid oxidase-like deaminating enzyme